MSSDDTPDMAEAIRAVGTGRNLGVSISIRPGLSPNTLHAIAETAVTLWNAQSGGTGKRMTLEIKGP